MHRAEHGNNEMLIASITFHTNKLLGLGVIVDTHMYLPVGLVPFIAVSGLCPGTTVGVFR